jgi:6-phosphogluconolactonase (cycloisomerase 2 family)
MLFHKQRQTTLEFKGWLSALTPKQTTGEARMVNRKAWMYVSLWREHGGAPGLALFSFDIGNGEMTFVKLINGRISFNCSHVNQQKGILYICNEDEKVFGVPYNTGRIYGYKIDPASGDLTEIFHRDTYCPNPAYVACDSAGEYMAVANHSVSGAFARLEKDETGGYSPRLVYPDALVELFSLNKDGTARELLDIKKHVEDGAVRTGRTHPHCAVFSPSEELLAVCDKGDGHIYLYAVEKSANALKPLSKTLTDSPGASPRYCVFHPMRPYFAVNHERMKDNRMVISSFHYTSDGQVTLADAVNALPENHVIPQKEHYEQQGMCISKDGKYIYTLMNGPNMIGVISMDGENGALRVIQTVELEGEWPRGIALAPGGGFIVTACLVSGDIRSFAVGADGRLSETQYRAKQRGASYMSFYSC